MTTLYEPGTVEELAEAVRSAPRVIAVDAGTKPRLSEAAGAVKISTARLTGITEYEPSEFTFTALAGTPMREIVSALAERGQYLPFDPLLVEAGATLGGTVAAGLSGPGRFRFGGVRDFILGVRFVDGRGRLLRMGGKVVKNAAGFDLPKFFVGSAGRFGVLAEITFKVFPRPSSSLTLGLAAETTEKAVKILTEAATSRFEFDALDVPPEEPVVLARIAGPETALKTLAREILARWAGEIAEAPAAEQRWRELREFTWAESGALLIKVPMSPSTLVRFEASRPSGIGCHLSAGGNVAYLSLPDEEQAEELDQLLRQLHLPGMTLRGNAPLWLGAQHRPAIATAVKPALDPDQRFPSLDD